MRVLIFALIASIAVSAQAQSKRFKVEWNYVSQTNPEDANPGVQVQVKLTKSAAAAYILRLVFITESNRVMRFSKLIEVRPDQRHAADSTISHVFDTGIGKIATITVEELKAVDLEFIALK